MSDCTARTIFWTWILFTDRIWLVNLIILPESFPDPEYTALNWIIDWLIVNVLCRARAKQLIICFWYEGRMRRARLRYDRTYLSNSYRGQLTFPERLLYLSSYDIFVNVGSDQRNSVGLYCYKAEGGFCDEVRLTRFVRFSLFFSSIFMC